MNTNFQEWKIRHAQFWGENVVASEGQDCKWGRLKCHWTEKQAQEGRLEHRFAACINRETGDVYIDCSKKKIWVKLSASSVFSLFLFAYKTICHIEEVLRLPYRTFQLIQIIRLEPNSQDLITAIPMALSEACQLTVSDAADIFRTPVYAVAMLVASVAGTILGPLFPRRLYDFREMIRVLEKSSNWGVEYSEWNFFRCFHPIGNIAVWGSRSIKKNRDTIYLKVSDKIETKILRKMANFARGNIKFLREEGNYFTDCGKRFPKDQAYKSPAWNGF